MKCVGGGEPREPSVQAPEARCCTQVDGNEDRERRGGDGVQEGGERR